MEKYKTRAIILGVLLIIAAIFFLKRGNRHFQEFDYEPSDWVTTQYTTFSTDFSGEIDRPSHNFHWEILPEGLHLKPIVRYNSKYIVTELPDGRRGIVIPSTLSGVLGDIGDFDAQEFGGGIKLNEEEANKYGDLRRAGENFYPLIGYMTPRELFFTDKNANKKRTEFGNMPGVVINTPTGYMALSALSIYPRFAECVPEFNDNFKVYVKTSKLEKMSRKSIERRYGEPVAVLSNSTLGTRAYYRHLRTKDNYNHYGVYIKYNSDGTTTIEDSSFVEDSQASGYVDRWSRPIISRITSIDWVDLPLAYPFVRLFHFNFADISTSSKGGGKPGWLVLLAVTAITAMLILLIEKLIVVFLFPIKSLNNIAIELLTLLITAPIILIIGAQYMEFFVSIWIVVALVVLFLLFIPFVKINKLLEFNRCNHCRQSFCVSHHSTLIDTKISHRERSHKSESVEQIGDKDSKSDKKLDKDNTKDKGKNFEEWNKRVTTTYRTTETVETSNHKYRHDFFCRACSKEWVTFKTKTSERVIASKKRKTGTKVEEREKM